MILTLVIIIIVLLFIIGCLIKWGYDDHIKIIALTDDNVKLQKANEKLKKRILSVPHPSF